jgi:uncharacterized protein (DUF2267 family)
VAFFIDNYFGKIKKGGSNMPLNFDKYANEGSQFVRNLAKKLGHPDEIGRTGIILRAVMHTLRERITISQSFHIIAQLPMFLKGMYVDEWQFRDTPIKINKKEDFLAEVKNYQIKYGEQEFNWEQPTEEIVKTVFREMGTYISRGEFEDIISQLPKELESLLRESIHA